MIMPAAPMNDFPFILTRNIIPPPRYEKGHEVHDKVNRQQASIESKKPHKRNIPRVSLDEQFAQERPLCRVLVDIVDGRWQMAPREPDFPVYHVDGYVLERGDPTHVGKDPDLAEPGVA